MIKRYKDHKDRRRARSAGKIIDSERPRLTVFRSNKKIYAQIADKTGNVLASVSGLKNVKSASEVGEKIAKDALGKKVKQVVFNRGAYKYHGRIKSLAEAARKGGLEF